MTFLTTDKFWRGDILGCDLKLAPWLHNHGSLTQRIQQRCTHFAVRKVHSGLARIALDESALLGIVSQQLAYSRDVILHADNQPVVFAHSVCATRALHGVWRAVAGLGNQPLGALLFAHPLVKRQPLHYKALRSNHLLYQQAATVLANPPSKLWGRRSLFYLHGVPLLVTEVFLPDILRISNRD
jgi:chorismate--pyruvate lyase